MLEPLKPVTHGAKVFLGAAFFVLFLGAWALATFGGLIDGMFLKDPLYNGLHQKRLTGDAYDALVEEFIKEVKVGPRSAQVTNLKIEWQQPADQYTHFEIR